MAASPPPWSALSKGAMTVVMDTVHHEKLTHHLPDLLSLLDLKSLRPYLLKYNVVTDISLQHIEAAPTHQEQVQALIAHLQLGPTHRYHAWLKSLAESNQAHIIHKLGLDAAPYQQSHQLKGLGGGAEEELMKGILEHCQSYHRNILCIAQLDMDEDSDHDIRPYLINVNLHMEKRGNLINIPDDSIFSHFMKDPPPCSVLLSGALGQGKSTYIKSYIQNWCQSQLSEPRERKVMVYIPAASVAGDLWTCVKRNIFCQTKARREAVFDFTQSGSEEVLIFIDGIDEVRDKVLLKHIQHFVDDCKNNGAPVVLVSTRDNLAGVKRVSFNRHLRIQGYSVDQGLEYANKYLGSEEAAQLHSQLREVKETSEIGVILKNPLRNHIFCLGVSYERLRIASLASLRITHLHDCVERLLLSRELVKSKSLDEEEDEDDDNNSKIRNFYIMCLYSVLKRKPSITEELLHKFQLDETSPMLRLLTKTRAGMTRTGRPKYVYTAPHESNLEYWCAQGIISLEENLRKVLLVYICTKMEWSNIQLMTYGALAHLEEQDEAQQLAELVSIIRYIIVLLPNNTELSQDAKYTLLRQAGEELVSKLEIIMTGTDQDGKDMLQELLQEQSCPPELLAEVLHLHGDVNCVFDRDYRYIQDHAWFRSVGPASYDDHLTSQHLHRCLEQSEPDQLGHVASKTLGLMLPCLGEKGWTFYHVPGTSRWGHMDPDHWLNSWSPTDGATILQQFISDARQPPTSSNTPTATNTTTTTTTTTSPNTPSTSNSPITTTTATISSKSPSTSISLAYSDPPLASTGTSSLDPQQEDLWIDCCNYGHIFGDPPEGAYSATCWAELLTTCSSVSFYKSIDLGLSVPECVEDSGVAIKSEPPWNQLLPLLEAMRSSIEHLYNNQVEQLKVWHGYIYLVKLVGWLQTMTEVGEVKVELVGPFIVVDEADEGSRNYNINFIKQSGFVKDPKWITPQGEKFEDFKEGGR